MSLRIKDWMEVARYKITEGSECNMDCYPEGAYFLDSWNQDQNGYQLTILFDRNTQTVYEATAYDYDAQEAYRWRNPEHVEKAIEWSKTRCYEDNEAWEGVTFSDSDDPFDWIGHADKIYNKFN